MVNSENSNSKIPQLFLDELLIRTDLVELIGSYITLEKKGQSYVARCPFHQEKTPSFNVVGKKQFYHCFGCGASGDAIRFIMTYLSQGFLEAVELLAARVGLNVPKVNTSTYTSPNLYQFLQKVSVYYQQVLKESPAAIAYLKSRGLNGEISKKYQLGYAPAGWHTLEAKFRLNQKELLDSGMIIKSDKGNTYDRYRERIMFPIHDKAGRVIGFGGRALSSLQEPKYLNSPETAIFHKNRELYGLYQVLQAPTLPEAFIIVEGYLDVISLAQFGINSAVAALGTAVSSSHIQLLKKHNKKLIFCFDGDQAGKQAAVKALTISLPSIEEGLDIRFALLPDKQDPDSFIRTAGKDAFYEAMSQALPLNEYFIQHLSQDLDIQSLAGKNLLIQKAKPYINTMQDGSYKQLLINELSRITRVENHRLEQIFLEKIPATPLPTEQKSINRSPLRLALALLLQNPDLYAKTATKINFEDMESPGLNSLRSILLYLAKNPDLTTAALMENWRGTELHSPFLKLAAWDHKVPQDALEKEFLDILTFLQKKETLETKINSYIEKARNQGLSIDEKLHLQNLIKRQHQTNDEK